MKCPKCNAGATQLDINIKTDVAQCKQCNHVFRLSSLFEEESEEIATKRDEQEYASFSIDNAPPTDCYYEKLAYARALGVNLNSKMGWVLVGFSIIWDSFLLFFFTELPLNQMGGSSIFILLFMLPFLAVGIGLPAYGLFLVKGKIEFLIDFDSVTLFRGVGNIGFKKKIVLQDVKSITKKKAPKSNSSKSQNLSTDGKPSKMVVIQTNKKIKFGQTLPEEKLNFLYFSIRKLWENYSK